MISSSRTARVMNDGCTSISAAALRKLGSTLRRSVREIAGEVAMELTISFLRNDCNVYIGSNLSSPPVLAPSRESSEETSVPLVLPRLLLVQRRARSVPLGVSGPRRLVSQILDRERVVVAEHL